MGFCVLDVERIEFDCLQSVLGRLKHCFRDRGENRREAGIRGKLGLTIPDGRPLAVWMARKDAR